MSYLPILEVVEKLRIVPDFPQPGIQFRDITPILEDSAAFKSLAFWMKGIVFPDTTHLMAIESRGFILASAMAQYLDVGVVLVRKPKKLPRETLFVDYELEYGRDRLEIHRDALSANDRVTIVDDVLATGGTARAVEKLVQQTGAVLLGSCFFLELLELGGSKNLSSSVRALHKI